MTVRLVIDPEATLVCGRCRQTTRRLILPYWREDGQKLCPACCEAAMIHYEALEEGWPPGPDGRRPPKLAELERFWFRWKRFPTDDERGDDGNLIHPPEPEPEETPEW